MHRRLQDVFVARAMQAPTPRLTFRVAQGLRAHGHLVEVGKYTAVTQAIVVDPNHDTLSGACDPRKDGAPAGY